MSYSISQPHGWGIALLDGNAPFLFKEGQAAHESFNAKWFAKGTKLTASTAIFHLRYASKGAVADRNAHPFVQDSWAFAHNGTVKPEANGIKPVKFNPTGETDSEIAFCYLMERLSGQKQSKQDKIIKSVADQIGYGFNFLLGKQDILYAYWSGYNSLYYLSIPKAGHIVSTVPLSGNEWMPFEKGQLMKFQGGYKL